MNTGVTVIGLKCPIIHSGDDIEKIVIDTVEQNIETISDGDIIGITESVVARANNEYCTIDDIAHSIRKMFPNTKKIQLFNPIASRNRFSYILRGIARAMDEVEICWPKLTDEVGNTVLCSHIITGISYAELYKQICEEENCKCTFIYNEDFPEGEWLDCRLRPVAYKSLKLVCGEKSEWGVLGSNIAGPDKLKLFPSNCQCLVERIQRYFKDKYNKRVEVLVYGDGCYKDPYTGIWEFADPVTSPGYTEGLEGTPTEAKLKNLAESMTDEQVKETIKENSVQHLGTTPRKYIDLIASLCDLTSGSGDKGTPIVYIQNYFNKYTD